MGLEGGKLKLQKLPFGDKENGPEMGSTYLKSLVPGAGIEPAQWKPPRDFKSNPWAFCNPLKSKNYIYYQ
jgi:hypothetical protein